jgi:hypothetical protein
MAKEDKAKKYYPADTEKMQKKLEELGSGSFFKPKEGKNVIRILPPWSKAGTWYKEATLHYVSAGEEKIKAYPCLKMYGKECPVCNKSEELASGGDEDQKIAERLRPRTKYYANIIDRKSGKAMLWGFSGKTLGILLGYQDDADYGKDISDPEEGFDVVIERQGTGRTDTRYQIRCKPKATAIEVDDWQEMMKNLDKEVTEEVDEEKLEELIEEKFGSVSPKKKKKVEDEEEEKEEEEEEEEKESKKKKSTKKTKGDDDDEDEDDDE